MDDEREVSWFGGNWVGPWWLVVVAAGFLIASSGTLIGAFTSTGLPFGPAYVVGESGGQTSIQVPTELSSFGLRFGWRASLALLGIAVALILFTLGQIGSRVPGVGLFSAEMKNWITLRYVAVVLLLAASGLLQEVLRSPVAEAVGISPDAQSPDSLWDVGPLLSPILYISVLLGWLFKQGSAIQEQAADIV